MRLGVKFKLAVIEPDKYTHTHTHTHTGTNTEREIEGSRKTDVIDSLQRMNFTTWVDASPSTLAYWTIVDFPSVPFCSLKSVEVL